MRIAHPGWLTLGLLGLLPLLPLSSLACLSGYEPPGRAEEGEGEEGEGEGGSEGEGEGGSEGEGEGGEPAVTVFVVRNVSASPRFLDWSLGGEHLLACNPTAPTEQHCYFQPPFCTPRCAEPGAEQPPCIGCGAPRPMVRSLLPGEVLEVVWDRRLFGGFDAGECDCFREIAPLGSPYAVSVCSGQRGNCPGEHGGTCPPVSAVFPGTPENVTCSSTLVDAVNPPPRVVIDLLDF